MDKLFEMAFVSGSLFAMLLIVSSVFAWIVVLPTIGLLYMIGLIN